MTTEKRIKRRLEGAGANEIKEITSFLEEIRD